jgi:hypothetical protein
MKILHSRALIVVGAALILMVGGAMAYAAIPSSGKVFTACVTKTNGAVRLIDAEATPAQSCKSSEIKTTWNQQGQPGTNGTNGTPGVDGVSGYQIVRATHNFAAGTPSEISTLSVDCPPGTVPLGGGGKFLERDGTPTISPTVQLTQTFPDEIGTPGWTVAYHAFDLNITGIGAVQVFAECAAVTP